MAKKYGQERLVKEVIKDDKKAKGGKRGTRREDELLGQASRDERKIRGDAKGDTMKSKGDAKFQDAKIKKSYAKKKK